MNHKNCLAELKSKIRNEIREGLGMVLKYVLFATLQTNITQIANITVDMKVAMQYDRYEKLIVVDKGVELVNWPDNLPFVNASKIGSLHSLRLLLIALTHEDIDKRCRWVRLSEEEWALRKTAYYNAEAEHPPHTRKSTTHVQDEANESDSPSNSHLLKDGAVSTVHGKGRNTMGTGRGKKSGRESKKGKRNVQPLQSSLNVVQ